MTTTTEPDTRERAVAIFEARMGFAFTDEYDQSREWSDAMAEAAGSPAPTPEQTGDA